MIKKKTIKINIPCDVTGSSVVDGSGVGGGRDGVGTGVVVFDNVGPNV